MKTKKYISEAREYRATDRMRDIIADNLLLLSTLSRFDIALGFGDSTVGDVCSRTGVDTNTFLAVANLMSYRPYTGIKIDINTLIRYLKNAHVYFLDYILPSIRRKLIDAMSVVERNEIPLLILKFFDDYHEEVEKHMNYENKYVFDYVDKLLAGEKPCNGFTIFDFEANHKPIASKLHELKEIIICHYTGEGNRVDLLNTALFDIIMCERDLLGHCEVEDRIFVPAVKILEESISSISTIPDKKESTGKSNAISELTDREKEIISCVARGMSNKEIADRLCLSVHTVATHRRNVSGKLEIHSTSGLTIFAIIHKLIDLSDMNPDNQSKSTIDC
ncbi:MAG: LuxR C-terminal-related transcriptional regulator [Clostridiales bacterium]|nr:LuxR C-terminal-related transcriptional regulator [Clostridiales bacterium]